MDNNKRRRRRMAAAALLAALAASSAQAQLGDMLKSILPTTTAAQKPPGDTPAADNAPPVNPNPGLASELAPDVNCDRPAEKFNLAEKVAQYGGTAAALRLQRLITTDFAYSSLTPEDKKMLEYLAQTTVWLPPEAETKLGSVFDLGKGLLNFNSPSMTEDEQQAQDAIRKRLDELRAQVPDYPSDIRLTVDKTLKDGAYARFGGVIQLSGRFLNGLEDAGDGAAFLLAHEMSHVYKRHAMKNLQFQLISSAEGWDLVRKVLKRAQRGAAVDPVADGVFLFTVVPQLIDLVRGLQIKFVVNQELEADACSVVWLQRLKLQPQVAWNAYQAKLGATTAYSEEHPSSAERAARFTRKAGGGGGKTEAEVKPDKNTVKEAGKRIVKDQGKTK